MKVSEVVCIQSPPLSSRTVIGTLVSRQSDSARLPIGTLGYYKHIGRMVVWNGQGWINSFTKIVNDGTAEGGVFIVAFPEDEFPQIK